MEKASVIAKKRTYITKKSFNAFMIEFINSEPLCTKIKEVVDPSLKEVIERVENIERDVEDVKSSGMDNASYISRQSESGEEEEVFSPPPKRQRRDEVNKCCACDQGNHTLKRYEIADGKYACQDCMKLKCSHCKKDLYKTNKDIQCVRYCEKRDFLCYRDCKSACEEKEWERKEKFKPGDIVRVKKGYMKTIQETKKCMCLHGYNKSTIWKARAIHILSLDRNSKDLRHSTYRFIAVYSDGREEEGGGICHHWLTFVVHSRDGYKRGRGRFGTKRQEKVESGSDSDSD
jgi:hypothetical protein